MNQLKELRKERGLTQKELAEKIGIATTTLAGYEQGYRGISVDKAKLLATALGCDWTIFFENKVLETTTK